MITYLKECLTVEAIINNTQPLSLTCIPTFVSCALVLSREVPFCHEKSNKNMNEN